MLDFSFLEISVVIIIALLVLGPERLPQVVRICGRAWAKWRRLWNILQQETENTLEDIHNADKKCRTKKDKNFNPKKEDIS